MTCIWWILAAVCSYLIGSLNFAIIFSRTAMKSDVRNSGSGNAGSTNMLRNYGWKVGVMTLLVDFFKTFLVTFATFLLFSAVNPEWRQAAVALSGFCCELGHCFPVFFNFKGGKGVAVGGITALMVDWRCFIIVILTFLIVVTLTKYVSLGSILGAFALPVSFAFLTDFKTVHGAVAFALTVLVAALIILLHRKNIGRLLRGNENKLSFHSK